MNRLLSPLFYFGFAFIMIGGLLKIQHYMDGLFGYPFFVFLLLAGLIVELAFFVGVIVEIARSNKASRRQKATFISIYAGGFIVSLCVPDIGFIMVIFILGMLYLNRWRKKILLTRMEHIMNTFDSI